MKYAGVISAVGSYLPSRCVTNDELARKVDTNNEWIVERTGITRRYIAAQGEYTSDLAVAAFQDALAGSGVKASDIDGVIVATTTPERTFPSVATMVQHKAGLRSGVFAFDVQAVCSGFIYALSVADSMMRGGGYRNIAVIGAETLSRIVDWEDRSTCILFGDGAGAVILSRHEEGRGVLASTLHSDGAYREILQTDGGVSLTGDAGLLRMQGREVFRHAVQKMYDASMECMHIAGVEADELDFILPHQANERILEAVVKKLGVPREKLISTVGMHANTSAASIPLGLAAYKDRIKQGDMLLMQAIGGGLSWGAALLKW